MLDVIGATHIKIAVVDICADNTTQMLGMGGYKCHPTLQVKALSQFAVMKSHVQL